VQAVKTKEFAGDLRRINVKRLLPPVRQFLAMAILPFRSILLLVALSLGSAGTSWAGSSTADSVWDEENARQRAIEQIPAGAVVGTTDCESFSVGIGNTRYRCTVNYTPAAPSNEASPRGD